MSKASAISLIPSERIEQSILLIRSHKVMLDSDLAALYGVPTKRLNEAVQRNLNRFPEDFMFQLTKQEVENLKFQFGTSSLEKSSKNQTDTNLKSQIATSSWGGKRKLPYVFTEQGIAMLSSVLRSERAVQVNIAIMRAFVKLRGMMQSQDILRRELSALKKLYKNHDEKISAIFLMIDEIVAPPLKIPKKRKIGFLRDNEE